MNLKKIIALIVGIISIALGGILLYRWQFLILDSSNLSNEVSDALPYIELNFNHPIDANQPLSERFTLSPTTMIQDIIVEGNKVKLTYDYLITKRTYTLTIRNLQSSNGKSYSTKKTFTTKYVESQDLNKEIINQTIEDTNKEQKEYPILAELPYETQEFKIEGIVNLDTKSVEYTITLFGIYNRPEQLAEFTAQNKQYKSAALTWLTSQKIDVANAKITYLPNDPDK